MTKEQVSKIVNEQFAYAESELKKFEKKKKEAPSIGKEKEALSEIFFYRGMRRSILNVAEKLNIDLDF